MPYLEAERAKRVYYEDYAADGIPVVLIHGWGMSVRCFDYNAPALHAAGYRVVGLDHRGCGRSDKDFEDVSISAIAGDVAAVCSELGLERPVLLGWSMGGAVAVEAADRLGSEVRGLVLVGAASPRYTQAEGWDIGADQATVDQTVEALRTTRASFLHDLTVGVFKDDPGQPVIEWMWSIFMQTSWNADSALAGLAAVDQRELMPRLDAPALLCAGPADQIVPFDTSVKAAELLPDARLVEFEDSGHAPFIEEHERFDRELLDFLSKLG